MPIAVTTQFGLSINICIVYVDCGALSCYNNIVSCVLRSVLLSAYSVVNGIWYANTQIGAPNAGDINIHVEALLRDYGLFIDFLEGKFHNKNRRAALIGYMISFEPTFILAYLLLWIHS